MKGSRASRLEVAWSAAAPLRYQRTVLPAGTLLPAGLRLRRALSVLLCTLDRQRVVAAAHELDAYGAGRDAQEAVADLLSVLARKYVALDARRARLSERNRHVLAELDESLLRGAEGPARNGLGLRPAGGGQGVAGEGPATLPPTPGAGSVS